MNPIDRAALNIQESAAYRQFDDVTVVYYGGEVIGMYAVGANGEISAFTATGKWETGTRPYVAQRTIAMQYLVARG